MAVAKPVDFSKSFDTICMIQKKKKKKKERRRRRREEEEEKVRGNKYDEGIDDLWTRGN